MQKTLVLLALLSIGVLTQNNLIFYDDFDEFDLSVWEHELTMGGGGFLIII